MRQHEDGEVFEETWADVPSSHEWDASRHEGEILNVLWEEGKGSGTTRIRGWRDVVPFP